ncbi:ABC transporter substrate-binding protein [Paenibacillus sp. CF384]|uniref:ABC transporter substrate-binding protein n=1 Tax=Paenibacillus sp. CF384 TaxID=1884382 RepID=UPI00089900B0|nr:ABC transporter substrate-binding protein [Paenibacillus sp. CF384]SDX87031.1 NitT/TauT family transport system substrate-binding protein [Paenibacillus sp. CF384]
MRMKLPLLLLMIMLTSALTLSACSKSTSGSEKDDITLRVAYNLWVGSAGLFVAESKGFFEEAGVKVDLIQFPSPTEATQALISGNVDVALTTLDTAVMVKTNELNDQNLKVFSFTDLSMGADGIVASKDIKTIADLKGKTVAATIGSVNHFLLNHALQLAGLSEKDVKLSNVSPEQTGPLFIAGQVDAAVTWEPYLSEALTGGGNLLYSTKDAPDLIIDGVMTPQAMIDDHEEALRKLVGAIDRGTAFYYSNTDEAADIAAKKLETTKDEVIAMMGGVKLLNQDEVKTMLTGKDSTLAQRAEEYSSFFFERKLIDKEVKADDILDSFLYK